jgi:hypothetical protein
MVSWFAIEFAPLVTESPTLQAGGPNTPRFRALMRLGDKPPSP